MTSLCFLLILAASLFYLLPMILVDARYLVGEELVTLLFLYKFCDLSFPSGVWVGNHGFQILLYQFLDLLSFFDQLHVVITSYSCAKILPFSTCVTVYV